jgi:hypothetical protein
MTNGGDLRGGVAVAVRGPRVVDACLCPHGGALAWSCVPNHAGSRTTAAGCLAGLGRSVAAERRAAGRVPARGALDPHARRDRRRVPRPVGCEDHKGAWGSWPHSFATQGSRLVPSAWLPSRTRSGAYGIRDHRHRGGPSQPPGRGRDEFLGAAMWRGSATGVASREWTEP